MSDLEPLGPFLRAHREAVDPADVGLPGGGRRRTPGLRREEVASLAGMSAQYYSRLEQGLDAHPSDSVVEALGRALRLDGDERSHLRLLAGVAEPRRPRRRRERADPSLVRLLDSWPGQPAVVIGRLRDVLAANEAATAVNPAFRAGVNLVRHAFLDPDARDVYPDWEEVAAGAVAGLRSGVDPADPGLAELVGELAVTSREFARMWGQQRVHVRTTGVKRFHHGTVGTLELPFHAFAVLGAPGQTLYLFPPDAQQREAIEFLMLAASARRPDPAGSTIPI